MMETHKMVNNTVNARMTHAPKVKPIRNTTKSFGQQEVDLSKTPLFFPAGLEKVFIAIYFVVLPYIAGIVFLLFYVSGGDFEMFFKINQDSSFLLTWVIGYEMLATLILLYIVKMAVSFSMSTSQSKKNKPFVRP